MNINMVHGDVLTARDRELVARGWRAGMEEARRVIAPINPYAGSPNAEVRCMCMAEIRKAINDRGN